MTMDKLTKTYRWNSQGVCENQDTPVSFFKNNTGFYIFTAQAPDGTWRAAHNILLPAGMAGYYCWLNDTAFFTEREAIVAKLREVLNYNGAPQAVVDEARRLLENYCYTQLSLF